MTNIFTLDWAIIAVSLFNTLLLLWLGLTVVLNAERRTLGVWIASGALLLGSLFFLSHSVLVSSGYPSATSGLEFWWRSGWLPVVCLPFAWYAVLLWYSGFWETGSQALRQRHRVWFYVTLIIAIGIIGLLIFAHPLPSVANILALDISASLSVSGVPVLFVIYPLYTVLCTVLSLDALRRPGLPRRVMGELARLRAWPWLAAASLSLLLVSLLVGGTVAWVVLVLRDQHLTIAVPVIIGWLDLLIASLIALAILFVGQAIASYEVFTGKALPRRGLLRYWQRAVILAVGFSVLLAGILLIRFPQIYTVLLALVLIAVFYALQSWRAFTERERSLEALRPFIYGQQYYTQILNQPLSIEGSAIPGQPSAFADTTPPDHLAFDALCRDLLGTKLAYLISLGELAPLAGSPLVYPSSIHVDIPLIEDLISVLTHSIDLYTPIPPDSYAGAAWAVPLRSERGMTGLLLLGEKVDGSLYAQEEMELARQAGESLLNARASAEIARRLVMLQRQRISESQVIDQRARRLLHDEVLPALHTTLLNLSTINSGTERSRLEAIQALSEAHGKISRLLRELPTQVAPELIHLGLPGALQQLAEVDLRDSFDEVHVHIDPAVEKPVRRLPSHVAEVIYYAAREAIRNAARHGRGYVEANMSLKDSEPTAIKPNAHLPLCLDLGLYWLTGESNPGLQLTITDTGVGLAPEAQNSNQSGGSGQGLALHSTLLAVIGGSLVLSSASGKPTTVTIFFPEAGIPQWEQS